MKTSLRWRWGLALVVLLAVGWAGPAVADQAVPESLTVAEARKLIANPPPLYHDLHGVWLPLDNLKTLDPEVAAVISETMGAVSLNGLTTLDAPTAAALARHQPVAVFGRADLRLNGLRELAPEAAEALAAHDGKVLLHSLEQLTSVPLAEKLAGQWGELRLGLTDLSPEIAAILATNKGVAEDRTRPGVVHRRRDQAASVLRLDRIESLTQETAAALTGHQGVLVLNGLTTIDPPVAVALAKRSGTLVLNGLLSISTAAATALATFPGELVLKGVTALTPETAAALAKHPGRLHLTGLTEVSPEVRAAFTTHNNVRLPRLPKDIRQASSANPLSQAE